MMILAWLRARLLGTMSMSMVVTLLAVSVGGIGLYTTVKAVKRAVVASRDVEWQSQLTAATERARREQAAVAQRAADAAEHARLTLESLEDARARVADLERALTAAQTVDGDPVIYPHALVRELRR